jgi:toxin CcdB
MAQWDVYANPSARSRDELPYVVVIQSDLLDSVATRWVTPLAREAGGRARLPARMSPQLQVNGQSLWLVPQETAPIDARSLKKPVANLAADTYRIIDALDAVISGV